VCVCVCIQTVSKLILKIWIFKKFATT